jgi:hypothetical protein
LIDIEFGTASQPLKTFNSLKRNNSGEYLIVPSELNNQLYVINARSKSKDHTSKWQTQIVFFDSLHRRPNFIQRKLFGNKAKPDSLMDENLILFEDRLELPSKLANQKIEVKANYFDSNYGWGIRIFYLPDFLYHVDIEYRHESSEIWRIGQSERPGKYNFGDIHGNLPFGETIRNLAPGKYFIRIRYEDELKRSIWFEGSAIIPNYSNGQLQ